MNGYIEFSSRDIKTIFNIQNPLQNLEKRHLGLLGSSDGEDSASSEVRLDGGDVDVIRKFVGAVDLAGDGSVRIVAGLVAAVDQKILSGHLHFDLLWREELHVESDLELVLGVVDLQIECERKKLLENSEVSGCFLAKRRRKW